MDEKTKAKRYKKSLGPSWCGSVVEHGPMHKEVTGSISRQGMCLGCSQAGSINTLKWEKIVVTYVFDLLRKGKNGT